MIQDSLALLNQQVPLASIQVFDRIRLWAEIRRSDINGFFRLQLPSTIVRLPEMP